MITALYGANIFQRDAALHELVASFDGLVERLDGSELTADDLAGITMGASLFSANRMVVIRDVASNKEVWPLLAAWLPRIPQETQLVLVDDAVDARTKTFKAIKAQGTVTEYPAMGEQQRGAVVQWLAGRAAEQYHTTITRQQADFIVARLGTDQARLDQLLQQLALMEQVSDEALAALLPLTKSQNVFALFEAGVAGDRQRVHEIIGYLEEADGQDGAYQTIGLLATQLWQFAALVSAAGAGDAVARDLGIHPFVLRKLAPYASAATPRSLAQMTQALMQADRHMKTTAVTPWLLVEHAVLAWSR